MILHFMKLVIIIVITYNHKMKLSKKWKLNEVQLTIQFHFSKKFFFFLLIFTKIFFYYFFLIWCLWSIGSYLNTQLFFIIFSQILYHLKIAKYILSSIFVYITLRDVLIRYINICKYRLDQSLYVMYRA